jgi:hypothetical protein
MPSFRGLVPVSVVTADSPFQRHLRGFDTPLLAAHAPGVTLSITSGATPAA